MLDLIVPYSYSQCVITRMDAIVSSSCYLTLEIKKQEPGGIDHTSEPVS